jgi:hypothetical protein
VPLGIWRAWTRQFLAGLLLFGAAQAQQQLVVNGVPVAGLTTEVVPGAAYAPVAAYARALGADYRVDPQAGVLLVFGGRILTLQSFGTPAEAAAATTALVRDGRRLPSSGAVAGGGHGLPAGQERIGGPGRRHGLSGGGGYGRRGLSPARGCWPPNRPVCGAASSAFVLSFSAPCKLRAPTSSRLSTWCAFAFLEPDWGARHWPARRFSGSRFSDAAFVPGGDFLDFNLTLLPGSSYSVFSEPTVPGSAW